MRGKHRLSNRIILTSIALIALLLPLTLFGRFEAYAPPTPAMSIEPPDRVDLALIAGKSFYTNVTVADVVNMAGYQFVLSYNTFVLTAVNYTVSVGSPFNETLAAEINDRTGFIAITADTSPPTGFTGATRLVKIGFKVDYLGESAFDLHDTKMWDLAGAAIAHSENDGHFRNVDATKIPVVSLTRNVTNPLDGQGIRFSAAGSTPGSGGGSITKYRWDFGTDIYLSPDGDGTYKAWTGTYREWDDPLDVYHDSDTTVVSTTSTNVNESSTLQNPPTLSTVRAHTIRAVNLTVVSKNVGAADEKIRAMLIIGGKGYNGTLSQPGTDYVGPKSSFTSQWLNNPANGLPWTWTDIDNLEAGVRSQKFGTTMGQVSVTQLFVTVFLTWVEYNQPTVTADYYFKYRGNYTVNLGVYNTAGAVGAAQAALNIKGHDVALTKFVYGGYKVMNPVANGKYTYWAGDYTAWDDWPTPDNATSYVSTMPVVNLKPTGAGTTYNNWTMVDISPDGDGTYTTWNGTYADWSDWPAPDTTTTVWAAKNNANESSTLVNPPSDVTLRSYTINRVRLTIFAKLNITDANNKVRLMLVIGGKGYNASGSTGLYGLTTTWTSYTCDWALNPSNGLAWTWTDLDNLQAGVRSQKTGATKSRIMVSQLFVSISTSGDWTALSEFPGQDGDASYIAATTNNLIETAAIENHAAQSWAIRRIRVNYFARNPLSGSDEKINPVIFIGGKLYFSNQTDRADIGYPGAPVYGEWEKNPVNNASWSWTDVDNLEAGFRSVMSSGYWTGELRITQMFVTVYADIETSKLTVPTTESFDIQNITISVWARSTIYTDDEIQLALISTIPGYTSILAPMTILSNTTWARYHTGYDVNPWEPPGTAWTWDVIRSLEVGVQQNVRNVEWTGEFQVTMIYVEVFGYEPPGTFSGPGSPPTYTIIKERPNEGLRVLVTVDNQGNFVENNVGVSLYWNTTLIQTQTIATLGIGDSALLQFTWIVNTPYNRTFILNAKTSTITGEYDTADNSIAVQNYGGLTRDAWVKIKLEGDANGDGRVNSLDVGKLNACWAPASGTPVWSAGWSMAVDPNEDGYINSLDFGVVNRYWGSAYP